MKRYAELIGNYKNLRIKSLKDNKLGVIEEVILVNETALNEIIIPTTNVDRVFLGPNGNMSDPDEVINQSQTYITSAGWKNSFARLKRFVGELKPCEPQNEGVAFSC